MSIVFQEDHPYIFVLSFIAIVQMVRIKAENMQISTLKSFCDCVFLKMLSTNVSLYIVEYFTSKLLAYWVFYAAYIRKTK